MRAYNSASEPTILNYTWPIFTVLFTETLFIQHRKKTQKTYIVEALGIILGFLSLVILITQGNIFSFHIANVKGLLWGLLAGSSYGFFSAFSSTVSKEKQGIFLLSSVFSSLVVMIFLSFSELSLLTTLTIKDAVVVFLLGSVVDGIGYIAWTGANRVAREKKISISSIASLVYFLPVLSLVIITIVFKEKTLFQPYFLVVLIFLLLSSIICQKARHLSV